MKLHRCAAKKNLSSPVPANTLYPDNKKSPIICDLNLSKNVRTIRSMKSIVTTFFTGASLTICLLAVALPRPAPAAEVVLEDNSVIAAFDTASGALTRMESKATRWKLERRLNLAAAFSLRTSRDNQGADFIDGTKHAQATVEMVSSNQVHIQWSQLTDSHGQPLPVTFAATITLQDGALRFEGSLTNDSPLMVESVDYPRLGDFNPPTPGAKMQTQYMWYDTFRIGDVFPSSTVFSCVSLFCLMQAADQGLYAAVHDPTQPYLVEFNTGPHPYAPRSAGHPTEFHLTHSVYAHPHTAVKLVPIVLHFYQGDWHAGLDIYKQWRATWFKPIPVPEWAREVHSWQQLQINTPEQDYRVPYTNLLAYGEECASNGVTAIQLVGWNHGGQDSGDPAQDTDPGLGTWQELHDAIAQIRARGVKMILFGKLFWADKTTAWEHNELYKYACVDPNGQRYQQHGYDYTTPTQLAGLNTHRRDIMDFNDPAYQAIAVREFKKILALNPDGWLWDEVSGHNPVAYNYAPGHGYTPPGYIYAADMPFARRIWAEARKVNPNFLFAGEALEDWLWPGYPFCYLRIFDEGHIPVGRYIDPQAPMMVAVTGFDDREMLNLILMCRYIISYEPYYFKGHLTDFPLTLAYGKKIDALRRRYHEYLWDANFQDTIGAGVTSNGNTRYSVFVTATGKRAVVVINQEETKTITAQVTLSNPGKLVTATPEAPEAQPTTGTLQIPARSAAVVMEE